MPNQVNGADGTSREDAILWDLARSAQDNPMSVQQRYAYLRFLKSLIEERTLDKVWDELMERRRAAGLPLIVSRDEEAPCATCGQTTRQAGEMSDGTYVPICLDCEARENNAL